MWILGLKGLNKSLLRKRKGGEKEKEKQVMLRKQPTFCDVTTGFPAK